MAKTDKDKLLSTHANLTHTENAKVISHVQRQDGEWVINTVMIENCDIPFKYKRKTGYKKLTGAHVNLTYYPTTEEVAGLPFDIMKVVRVRRS